MHQHGKVDGNHAQIVQGLRAVGYGVRSLASIGDGVPDIVVGAHFHNVLLEIKQPGERLTPAEQEFHRLWPGQVAIAHTVEEALAVIAELTACGAWSPR